jgi:L-fuconolactonase
MIIDTHTHFYDPSRPQGVPWPAPSEEQLYRTVLPGHYQALARPLGVDGTVVVEASSWVEDNQWVLDLAAADPFIVGLVGHLEPGDTDFSRNLDRFAANPLFRGIRLGSGHLQQTDGGRLRQALDALARKDLELDLLVGPADLPGLADLSRRTPELRIVVDHIAGGAIDGGPPDPQWQQAMQRVAEQPRIYCKVSALVELSRVQPAPTQLDYYVPVLDALWHAFGPDRLVYGSNWPVCEHSGSYATVQRIAGEYFAAKGEDALARFCWKNSRAAYKWVERRGADPRKR